MWTWWFNHRKLTFWNKYACFLAWIKNSWWNIIKIDYYTMRKQKYLSCFKLWFTWINKWFSQWTNALPLLVFNKGYANTNKHETQVKTVSLCAKCLLVRNMKFVHVAKEKNNRNFSWKGFCSSTDVKPVKPSGQLVRVWYDRL